MAVAVAVMLGLVMACCRLEVSYSRDHFGLRFNLHFLIRLHFDFFRKTCC